MKRNSHGLTWSGHTICTPFPFIFPLSLGRPLKFPSNLNELIFDWIVNAKQNIQRAAAFRSLFTPMWRTVARSSTANEWCWCRQICMTHWRRVPSTGPDSRATQPENRWASFRPLAIAPESRRAAASIESPWNDTIRCCWSNVRS